MDTFGFTLRFLQEDQKHWINYNFFGRKSHQPLIGAVEELGELTSIAGIEYNEHILELIKALGRCSHAHLKSEQGIRVNEKHLDNIKDAVADIIIFLCDYATAIGFDIHDEVEKTWNEVKKRDFKKFPKNGRTE